MPSKNRDKIYLSDSFYHLYNRGVNKRKIFLVEDDYAVFLNLLKRYLSPETVKDDKGRGYPSLYSRLELLAFCLMPNHFHLLIYQKDKGAMTQLLRGVATSYTMYFNKKYKRVGPLFQNRFKASMIIRDDYLQHISRYIHLNPKAYKIWEFSSFPYYLGDKQAGWLNPERILEIFDNPEEYETFVADYEAQKEMLDELKGELANY